MFRGRRVSFVLVAGSPGSCSVCAAPSIRYFCALSTERDSSKDPLFYFASGDREVTIFNLAETIQYQTKATRVPERRLPGCEATAFALP